MKTKKKSREKGSIILISLLFGIVFSTLVASVLGYTASEQKIAFHSMQRDVAFHLAEGGIERALYALQYGELDTTLTSNNVYWERTGAYSWQLTDNGKQIGKSVGNLTVYVEQMTTDTFKFISTGVIDYGPGSVTKKIQVYVDLTDVPGNSTKLRLPDFIVKDYISLGGEKGPTTIASCDSSLHEDPIFTPASKKNVGYDVLVGSLSDNVSAVVVDKTWIDGSVVVGGEKPPQFSSSENSDRPEHHAVLQGPDTPSNVLWDSDRVIPNFTLELPDASLPDTTGYQKTTMSSVPQNSEVILGEMHKPTFVTISNDLFLRNNTIIAQGDVILYVDGSFKSDGINTITLNGDSSQLLVVSANEINLGGENTVDARYPGQLAILQPEDGGDITISTEDWKGFITAPDSAVTLNGTADPNGNSKNEYWGGIISERLVHTGTWELVSDSSMRNQSTTTEPGIQTHLAVVTSWGEIY